MAANRFRCAEWWAVRGWVLGAFLVLVGPASAVEPLRDMPIVWYADDQRPLEIPPEERDPSLVWDYLDETAFRPLGYHLDPVRNLRRLVPGVEADKPASNVNRLGEVPNSSWFTNRIGLFPMTPEQVAAGPNRGDGPSREGPWTVVGAKTQGVTPGFTIEDVRGDRYLIKFGPREHPVMPTAAGVISQRLLHAIGYWVPEDDIVHFRREDLVLGDEVRITLEDGEKRAMTATDLDAILERVEVGEDGRIRAISSRFLPGRPLGPFDYKDRRDDDPNDRVKHHHRRELRALRVFAEWIHHFDVKQQNTLDVLVEGEDGGRHVRHYLIDFASTLGTGAHGPIRKWGWEAALDPKAVLRRTLNLGLREDDYRRVERPEGLDAIGTFEAELFEPGGYEPPLANHAFEHLTDRDGYWAAKILSAFSDDHLRAAVEQGHYRDPRETEYMTRTLAARRDAICRAWFERVAPLDFFVLANGRIVYRDLGVERGIFPVVDPREAPRYRSRVGACDAERRPFVEESWEEGDVTRVSLDRSSVHDAPVADFPFVHLEVQVRRHDGDWSGSVHAWVGRRSGRVVDVHRETD